MAGNISKYFYKAVAHRTCADFHHPGKTCFQAAKECASAGVIGSIKFYLPLCILPLLFKIKHWNEIKTWKEFLKNYGRCVFSGFFITTTGFILFCLAYNIFKAYYLPLIVILPSSLGAIFCGLLPQKYLHIDGLGLLNMYIEFVIKQSKLKSIVWLRNSKIAATCLYFFLNSSIIYYLYKMKSHRFWFVNIGSVLNDADADVNENESKNMICSHGNVSCKEFLKKEFKQTIFFAFGVSFFKLIFPRLTSIVQRPLNFLTTFYKKLDYNLIMFLLFSNGIFKYAFCHFNKINKYSKEVNCLIAGILSSIGYAFYPRYIIFTMGLTTLIEVIYKYINFKYESKQKMLPIIMHFINRLPICELNYMFSIGMMFQLRILYPHLTNRFIHKMMSIGTAGRADEVAKNYAGIMMGLQ